MMILGSPCARSSNTHGVLHKRCSRRLPLSLQGFCEGSEHMGSLHHLRERHEVGEQIAKVLNSFGLVQCTNTQVSDTLP